MTEVTAGSGARNHSLAVRRALLLLDVLGESESALPLAEVARSSKVNKSTALRLLSALCDTGFVQQHRSGQYRLGVKLLTLGQKYLASLDLRSVAKPFLEGLAEQTRETVHLVVIDLPDAVYVDKVDTPRAVRMFSSIGARNPAHCTAAGKAALAFGDPTDVEVVVSTGLPARTPNTITSKKQLLAELDAVRRCGYAVDDEENEQEIRCVGAVIRDHTETVVAAVSVSAPSARLPRSVIPLLGERVSAVAEAISYQLGAAVNA